MKIKELRKLTISKRLNILVGSGCSSAAIPLMGEFNKKYKCTKEANNNLIEKVKQVSEELTSNNYSADVTQTLNVYMAFIRQIVENLNMSNSRETPRRANIFTTNYDFFIEKAFDQVSRNYKFVINDGATGYFDRVLESSNFDQVVSYKGMNDNYISEIPSISLIKPHGSVNWEKYKGDESIYIRSKVVNEPVIVKPTGFESNDAFSQNHFFSMLRFFTNELDKPQSVLLVIGFSFQDKHIAKMVKRAIANPELIVICFCYAENDADTIIKNLDYKSDGKTPNNIYFIVPEDKNNDNMKYHEYELPGTKEITLSTLVKFMSGEFDENDDE